MNYRTFFLFQLLVGLLFSGGVQAQYMDPLKQVFDQAREYILQLEQDDGHLMHLHCDVIPRDEDVTVSVFDLRAGQDYRFQLFTNDDIEQISIQVFDINDADTPLVSKLVEGGQGTLDFKGHGGNGMVILHVEAYQRDALQGFYALAVSSIKAYQSSLPGRLEAERQGDITDVLEEMERPEKHTEEQAAQQGENCDYSRIEGLSFVTRVQKISGSGTERERIFKSKVKLDDELLVLEHKISKGGKFQYRITGKHCEGPGLFVLKAENDLGEIYTLTIDLNRNKFSLQPEGSEQYASYDIYNIKT
ncbi:MAG: hypothetical protein D6730_19680 [Bacteroidetes bacterium]|nr:MAG: hypothetical protein D6730_19680 [Bacteroidota bacterium]